MYAKQERISLAKLSRRARSQSRQNTICGSVHSARRAFYCIGNSEEFPMQNKKRKCVIALSLFILHILLL